MGSPFSWRRGELLKKVNMTIRLIITGDHMINWKYICTYCGKIFTDDIKERVVNDYIMHHQDNHASKDSIYNLDIVPEPVEM